MSEDDIEAAAKKTSILFDLRAVEVFLDEVSLAAQDRIRSNLQTEGHVISGELLGSIDEYERGPGYRVVGSDKPQANWLENGRPEVRPVNAKALRWQDKHTGDVVFSQYSGPTEPTHIFERSILEVAEPMGEAFGAKERRRMEGL